MPPAIDPKPLRWILCDLGKTLVNFDHRIAARKLLDYLNANCGDSSSGCTADQLFQFFFGRSGTEVRNVILERGERDLDWLAEEITREFGVAITVELLDQYWNDIFLDTNPEVFDAMRRARQRGIRVAICSNTTRAHWEFILRHYPEMHGMYDHAFLSFEMGMTKTQAGFFESITKTTGVMPDEHLFIDDLQENLDAAAKAGIQTLLYARNVTSLGFWDK